MDGTFELYQGLLLEEIEGFLIDEPSAEYFELLYPDRLTYFRKDFEKMNMLLVFKVMIY